MKRLTDAEYLSRQTAVPVPETQVPGLTPSIKEMCQLSLVYGFDGVSAPEVGIPYQFFIAWNGDAQNAAFDTLFNPQWEPVCESRDGVQVAPQTYVQQPDISGTLRKTLRYKKISLSWDYYNGSKFERLEGEFEGPICYLAQLMCDRICGVYLKEESDV
tara:strand:+ start:4096 stop:4572 length:477 start_codon:yes stop_codon:yes gene_type:complete